MNKILNEHTSKNATTVIVMVYSLRYLKERYSKSKENYNMQQDVRNDTSSAYE